MITQNLTLNLIPSGVLPRLNVSQYDKGETINVSLYNGATPFTLPSGATVVVSGTKADGTGFEYACNTSGGVSFTITEQMTVFAGEVAAELTITKGDDRISTINFVLVVERAALQDDVPISETDIPVIEMIPEYLSEAAGYVDDAEAAADLAHKWATFGAASEQPSASNNAKYWAERAAQTDIGQATTVAYAPDTAPYSFRRSTHNAVYDKLVGISWVENQLVQNGNFANGTTGWATFQSRGTVSASNNVLTVSANSEISGIGLRVLRSLTVVSGHKCFVTADIKFTSAVNGCVRFTNSSNIVSKQLTANAYTTVCGVVPAEDTTTSIEIYTLGNYAAGDSYQVQNVNVVDLTLQFGTAIADKIYTMEQATAGSGLAWIRQYGFLDGGYIAYNVGQIKSAIPKWRKVVGFNQWDEVAELGGISDEGSNLANAKRIRSKNYIPCTPNTGYYFRYGGTSTTRTLKICFYDADKNFISFQTDLNWNAIRTTPSGAHYMRFAFVSVDITTYNHDICINISDSQKNGTYEPYTFITYPLGGDELRGVPTLSGNNLVADGDVKTSDGVVNNKWNLLNLGTKSYTRTTDYDNPFFHTIIDDRKKGDVEGLCSKYTVYHTANASEFGANAPDKSICFNKVSTSVQIFIRDDSYTDAASLKAALSGQYLLYPLATPTTSVSTPFTSPQVSLVTEETDTPCGHDSVVVDIPEWMRNQYFDDVRAEASKAELLEQFLDIKVEDKTSGGYARFKRCGNHVECTINSYSVTDGGAGIEVPEQFRTSVAEYGFAFASTESAAVAVTYAPSTNKLTFRNANLTSYATGNMHGSISWYIE